MTTDSQMGYNYAFWGNHLSRKLSETYLEPLRHQIGHLLTEKSKEFLESKLYKKVASQVIHGALNNPLSQDCLVFLGFLNFMFKGKSSEKTWTYNVRLYNCRCQPQDKKCLSNWMKSLIFKW